MEMASGDRPDIVIGTRGSQLALAQAHEVRDHLKAAHGGALTVGVEIISTKGDRVLDRPLSEIGGKGLFTEEIEERLSDGRIDIAVHSAKDMPTKLPEGLELHGYLKREAAGDAFVSRRAKTLSDLAPGAVLGSSSLRRRALVLRVRPDIRVVEFRGNVQTRLGKLDSGIAEATLLAEAGLNRLGLREIIASSLPIEDFPPAPGQGAICIESRSGDGRVGRLLEAIEDGDTAIRLAAERAFLAVLDGSCRTPLAGHATLSGGRLSFHGMILKPDGSEWHEVRLEGTISDAAGIGEEAARKLRAQAGEDFFEDWKIPA